MADICPLFIIRHEPPAPLNNFEKFSDDFVSDFQAKSQDEAVTLAHTFLNEVQKWPELQQQIMLEKAQQSHAATGCGLDIPRRTGEIINK
jgi:plasmid maintenance system antidote protein VapI